MATDRLATSLHNNFTIGNTETYKKFAGRSGLSAQRRLSCRADAIARGDRRSCQVSLWKTHTSRNKHFANHGNAANSKGIYVSRVNPEIHTNTVERLFSIFKHGTKGVYHHCGEAYLHRYLAEFEFRYIYCVANGDDEDARILEAMRGAVGKRLLYADSCAA